MITRPPLPYKLLKSNTYEELLWTQEWLECRERIKQRDNYTCTKCLIQQQKLVQENNHVRKYFDLLNGTYVDQPGGDLIIEMKDLSYYEIDENVQLEVHHKRYIWKLLPWMYSDSELTTLCSVCHEKEHSKNPPLVYLDESFTTIKKMEICKKCIGAGYIKEFKHINGGVCFDCWGCGGH